MLQNNDEMSFDQDTGHNGSLTDQEQYEQMENLKQQIKAYEDMSRMLRENKTHFDQANFVNQTGKKYNK